MGYYRIGRHQRNRVINEHGAETPYTDAIVKKAAIARIKRRPWAHIRAVVPLFWRSLFVERGFETARPVRLKLVGEVAISLGLTALYLFAVFTSIRQRLWGWFGFLFPGIYLMALNAAVSHCLPRYNQPLIPIFIVASVVVLSGRPLSR